MSEETTLEVLQGIDWPVHFNERELKEIEFACEYADKFNHGTTGHNQLVLIAKLKGLLDQFQGLANEL